MAMPVKQASEAIRLFRAPARQASCLWTGYGVGNGRAFVRGDTMR